MVRQLFKKVLDELGSKQDMCTVKKHKLYSLRYTAIFVRNSFQIKNELQRLHGTNANFYQFKMKNLSLNLYMIFNIIIMNVDAVIISNVPSHPKRDQQGDVVSYD